MLHACFLISEKWRCKASPIKIRGIQKSIIVVKLAAKSIGTAALK
jgi:hypothetical protein